MYVLCFVSHSGNGKTGSNSNSENMKGLRCVPIHLPLSRVTSVNHTSPMSLFTLACPHSLAVFCFACSVWFLSSESESMWTAEKFSSGQTDIQKPAVGFGYTREGAEKFSSVRTDWCACSFLQRTIHWSGPFHTFSTFLPSWLPLCTRTQAYPQKL